MTDEQIKQNAEQYALKRTLISTDSFHGMAESYLEGAHSRDEEIAGYQMQINMTADALQQCMDELNKLRNPWIRVDLRLPEEDLDNKGYSVEVIGLFHDESISKCYCSMDEGIWFIEEFTCDKPTHWMPIPKLKQY